MNNYYYNYDLYNNYEEQLRRSRFIGMLLSQRAGFMQPIVPPNAKAGLKHTNGSVSFYENIDDAFDNIANGDTVILEKNCEISKTHCFCDAKSFSIDLNGNELIEPNGKTIRFYSKQGDTSTVNISIANGRINLDDWNDGTDDIICFQPNKYGWNAETQKQIGKLEGAETPTYQSATLRNLTIEYTKDFPLLCPWICQGSSVLINGCNIKCKNWSINNSGGGYCETKELRDRWPRKTTIESSNIIANMITLSDANNFKIESGIFDSYDTDNLSFRLGFDYNAVDILSSYINGGIFKKNIVFFPLHAMNDSKTPQTIKRNDGKTGETHLYISGGVFEGEIDIVYPTSKENVTGVFHSSPMVHISGGKFKIDPTPLTTGEYPKADIPNGKRFELGTDGYYSLI